MPLLATDERVTTLTDAAYKLDLNGIVSELAGENATEVSSNAFVRYLMDRLDYTIEFAKNMIYALVEMGKLIITERYTLRVAA
jgi:proteasome assembly chaperone (PAC2) family protein